MAARQENLNEVDKLLQKMELENKQQMRPVQAERQKSQAYQQQLNETLERIRELDTSTSQLAAKEKQLQVNLKKHRDKLESFKETVPVLEEHEEALKQKLQQTLMTTQQQSTQQHDALQKYKDIWSKYQIKYESSERAKEVLAAKGSMNQLQERDHTLQSQIQSLQHTMELLQQKEDDDDEVTVWVTKLATHRSDTTATHTQLKLTWAAIIELQAEIENAKDQLKAMHSDSKKQAALPAAGEEDAQEVTHYAAAEVNMNQQPPPPPPSPSPPPPSSSISPVLPVAGSNSGSEEMDVISANRYPSSTGSTSIASPALQHGASSVFFPGLIYSPRRPTSASNSTHHQPGGEGGGGRRETGGGQRHSSRFTLQIPQLSIPTINVPCSNYQTATSHSPSSTSMLTPLRQRSTAPILNTERSQQPPAQSSTSPLGGHTFVVPTATTRPASTLRVAQTSSVTGEEHQLQSATPTPHANTTLLPIISDPQPAANQTDTAQPQYTPEQDSNKLMSVSSSDQSLENHVDNQHQEQHVEGSHRHIQRSLVPEQQAVSLPPHTQAPSYPERSSPVPEQQAASLPSHPTQNDNFFSTLFGNQSLEQGSMWGVPAQASGSDEVTQQQNNLFPFSSSTMDQGSSAVDFSSLFGNTGGGSSQPNCFNLDLAPASSSSGPDFLFGSGVTGGSNGGNTGFQLSFDLPASTSSTNGDSTSFSLF